MTKKLGITLLVATVASLLVITVAFALALAPPVEKALVEDPSREDTAWMQPPEAAMEAAAELADQTTVNAPFGGPVPAAGHWYLLNGAFDDDWDGNTPLFWNVYAGDADEYGMFHYENFDASGNPVDWGFYFAIDNNEVKADNNAYLYQEISLPAGDYWVDVHSTIYGVDTWNLVAPEAYSSRTYNYYTYYALVPKAETMTGGAFDPSSIDGGYWKEMWPWSEVCNEQLKGWGGPGYGVNWCNYVQRAETVSVAGGEYVFVLRAEMKWPDWRAFGVYIFDDMQIIAADPTQAATNVCEDDFCNEGVIIR